MDEVGCALPEGEPFVEPLGVARIDARDLLPGPRFVLPEGEVLAVAKGQDRERVDWVTDEAVALEFQVVDDPLLEIPADVRARRHPVTREDLLGVGRAPNLLPPLENRDLEAGPGEVERGDQSVVAAADDDGVVALLRHCRRHSVA